MKIKRLWGISAFLETGQMDEVERLFRDVLGAKITPEMPGTLNYGQRAKGAWLGTEELFRVELAESINDDLPVGRMIKRLAPSFAVSFEVESVDEVIAELRAKGVKCSDKEAVLFPGMETEDGFQGLYETMISPKHAGGVLIEFLEFKKSPPPLEY